MQAMFGLLSGQAGKAQRGQWENSLATALPKICKPTVGCKEPGKKVSRGACGWVPGAVLGGCEAQGHLETEQ